MEWVQGKVQRKLGLGLGLGSRVAWLVHKVCDGMAVRGSKGGTSKDATRSVRRIPAYIAAAAAAAAVCMLVCPPHPHSLMLLCCARRRAMPPTRQATWRGLCGSTQPRLRQPTASASGTWRQMLTPARRRRQSLPKSLHMWVCAFVCMIANWGGGRRRGEAAQGLASTCMALALLLFAGKPPDIVPSSPPNTLHYTCHECRLGM